MGVVKASAACPASIINLNTLINRTKTMNILPCIIAILFFWPNRSDIIKEVKQIIKPHGNSQVIEDMPNTITPELDFG